MRLLSYILIFLHISMIAFAEAEFNEALYSHNLRFISEYTHQYSRISVSSNNSAGSCKLSAGNYSLFKNENKIVECIENTYDFLLQSNENHEQIFDSLTGLSNLIHDHERHGWKSLAEELKIFKRSLIRRLPHTIPIMPAKPKEAYSINWESSDPKLSANDLIKRKLAKEERKKIKSEKINEAEKSASMLLHKIESYLAGNAVSQKSVFRGNRRTVNVFLMGTGTSASDSLPSEYYPDGKLVPVLAANTVGIEHIDWIAINGLASDDNNILSKAFEGILGWGLRDMTTKARHTLALVKHAFDQIHHREISDAQQLVLMKAVKACLNNGDIWGIGRINLIGHSRGGATAIKLAAMLYQDPAFKDIPVNLFTIDPAHGRNFYKTDKSQYVIYPNVKNYSTVIAQNERSAYFEVIVPKVISNETKVSIHIVPGDHSTVAGFVQNKTKDTAYDLSASGKIVRNLAEDFLERNGALLKNTLDLDSYDAALLQQKIESNWKGYEELQTQAFFYYKNMDQEGFRFTFSGKKFPYNKFETLLSDDADSVIREQSE